MTTRRCGRAVRATSPSSIAITPDDKYVYITNTASDTVSMITLSTGALKTITGVGNSPTDVVLAAGKAYVSNLDGTVAVISTSSNTITGRVTVGVPAKSVALTPDGGLLLVAGTNDTVTAIDTATNTVVSTLITDPTPDTASSPTWRWPPTAPSTRPTTPTTRCAR